MAHNEGDEGEGERDGDAVTARPERAFCSCIDNADVLAFSHARYSPPASTACTPSHPALTGRHLFFRTPVWDPMPLPPLPVNENRFMRRCGAGTDFDNLNFQTRPTIYRTNTTLQGCNDEVSSK